MLRPVRDVACFGTIAYVLAPVGAPERRAEPAVRCPASTSRRGRAEDPVQEPPQPDATRDRLRIASPRRKRCNNLRPSCALLEDERTYELLIGTLFDSYSEYLFRSISGMEASSDKKMRGPYGRSASRDLTRHWPSSGWSQSCSFLPEDDRRNTRKCDTRRRIQRRNRDEQEANSDTFGRWCAILDGCA